MFNRLLNQFAPRTSPQTRLTSAALIWMIVGIFLIAKGIWISYDGKIISTIFATISGLILGLVKSRFVFDRVATKIIDHIGDRPNLSCLGGLFSVRNWALILIMAIFGKAFGALPIHESLKTSVYVMVGSGLAYSSRLLWNFLASSVSATTQRL